jgi:hypothetical protein
MEKLYQTASKDDGLEGYVISTSDNKYRAILRDTDANETLYMLTSPSMSCAVDLCETFTTGVKR